MQCFTDFDSCKRNSCLSSRIYQSSWLHILKSNCIMQFTPNIPGWSSGPVHQWAHLHGNCNFYHSTSREKASGFSLHRICIVLGGSSGYTKNHLSYQMTHQTLANNAYALHGGHVVIVKVWAIHMPVGKTKAQLIRVSQTFENMDLVGLT